MSEVIKDSAIKLFGKTISLPPADKLLVSDASLSEQRHSSFASSTSHDSKDESTGGDDCDSGNNPSEEKSATSSDNSDDPKKEETKKPDKIIPCPRCNSMDTKFCYFNNYNVNQPRHFCKKCQRYWTCGGTMRNVAVGSGRRKTKNSLLPNYPSIMVSDTQISSFLISPHGFPVSFYPATLYCSAAAPPPPCVLGKHSREGSDGVLVPKTLRIHDPSEAAKSSIWSTLGIKNDVGLFKAFESKGDRHRSVDHRAMMLQANPAALSRSLDFHERA